jgi:endonuclease/exonuclease/phosphatase family metal-dependent hydrolase
MVALKRVRTRPTTAASAAASRARGALSLALVALSACAARHIPAPAPAPVLVPCAAADCLRVLTWNVHAIPFIAPAPAARLRNVAAKLREQQPDVVLLQEMWSWAYVRQLARDLPEYRPVYARGCRRPFPCGGLVVLVRAASARVASPPTFVAYEASAPWYRFREWDGLVKKGALLVTITHGRTGETIGVVNTHLQTEYGYLGRDYSELRRRQLEQLDGLVRARLDGLPVVIAGDFNTAPHERSGLYGSHFARLGDDRTVAERAACRCGTRPPGSYRVASRWLDYVLTRRLGERATAVRITNDWVDRPFSDHDGVLVRLEDEMP